MKGYENTCHWCADGEKPVTHGCMACRHIFCDDCWHPTLGCPRCFGEAARIARETGDYLRETGTVK